MNKNFLRVLIILSICIIGAIILFTAYKKDWLSFLGINYTQVESGVLFEEDIDSFVAKKVIVLDIDEDMLILRDENGKEQAFRSSELYLVLRNYISEVYFEETNIDYVEVGKGADALLLVESDESGEISESNGRVERKLLILEGEYNSDLDISDIL